MPDYELIQLIQNSMTHVSDMTQNLVVGIFAFITANYFAAKNINWLAFSILAAIFILYSSTQLNGMYYSFENLAVFVEEAASRPSLSSDMPLYTIENVAATRNALPWNFTVYGLSVLVSLLFAVLLKAGKLRV